MDRNRDLFWKLIEPEHPRAQAFCRKLMRNREEGDDLYQDCLVVAVTQFDKLKETDSFRPWLYRIIVNRFKNIIRRPWWKSLVPLTREIEETAITEGPLARLQARRTLAVAFGALSGSERALVTLFELEDWTIGELAELNGLSESATKVRLFRARRKMREALVEASLSTERKKKRKPLMSEDEVCVAMKSGRD